MINHPNRSKKARVEFVPIFRATFGEAPGQIDFTFPNTAEISLTGEAPDAFEGAYFYSEPPVYPCIIITGGGAFRHVPNRMLRGPDDLKIYRREFVARKVWKYETMSVGASLVAEKEVYARNDQARAQNKARGDAARSRPHV